MNKKTIAIISLCVVLAAGLLAGGIVYKRTTAGADDGVSSIPEVKTYTAEEQAYFSQMDKKLSEKYGLSTNDRVVYLDSGMERTEPEDAAKKEIWQFLTDDFIPCEIPAGKADKLYGSWGVKIGVRVFQESGYFADADDGYKYFESYIEKSPEEVELYKVKDDIYRQLLNKL